MTSTPAALRLCRSEAAGTLPSNEMRTSARPASSNFKAGLNDRSTSSSALAAASEDRDNACAAGAASCSRPPPRFRTPSFASTEAGELTSAAIAHARAVAPRCERRARSQGNPSWLFMNISPCIFPNDPFGRLWSALDESRASLHVMLTFARTYAFIYSDSIRGIFFNSARYTRTVRCSVFASCIEQFMHSSMRLLDRNVGVRAHARVGVRDGNAPEASASDDIRHVVGRCIAIDEAVVFRRIAVRPAIDRDAGDISSGLEAAAAQCAAELAADLALEGLERCREQFGAAGFVLFALGQSVLRGCPLHADEDRLVGRLHAPVVADVDGFVQAEAGEVAARRF